MSQVIRGAAIASVLALAACGGGGGRSALVPALLPVQAASNAVAPARATQTASVTLSVAFAIPAASAHRARYISPSTKSMTVVVTPQGAAAQFVSADCNGSCGATITAPVGVVTFDVSLYSAAGGGGTLLSSGRTSTTIVGGQTNNVGIAFGGNVASLAISYDASKLAGGTAATIPVNVVAFDGGGNAIVGNEPFLTPITLAESDASGVLKLSQTTLTSPASTVSLAYTGGGVGATSLTARAGSVASTANVGALTPPSSVAISIAVPTATPAAAPGVPAHVLTYLYYGAANLNNAIPAAFMAARASFAEMSEGQAAIVNSYKAAGGKNAIVYSDPTYQPYCIAPLTAAPYGACSGPIAALIASESGYYHTASGARIAKAQPGSAGNYQEVLNLGSAAAQAAYHTFTANFVAQAPQVDLFFADDSGASYANGSGDPMTGLFYGFSGAAVEVTSATDFQNQEKAMLASAARPVIINGSDVETWKPAYNGAFVTAPNVVGENHEGCFNDGNGVQGDANGYFATQANGLLANTAYARYAVCMMTGRATPAARTYQLAAWWLTYDPAWSVAGPVSPAGDGYAVFPEYDIVPQAPKQSATTDIAALRSAGGAYVREFANCYQAGVAIGACAAVVNTTAGTLALPALSRSYSRSLVLNDASSFTTGTATWTATPGSVGALAAVVLAQ